MLTDDTRDRATDPDAGGQASSAPATGSHAQPTAQAAPVRQTPWVTKYKPEHLDQLLCSPKTLAIFGLFEAGEVKNLLLHGPTGSGKTTAARLLTKTLDPHWIDVGPEGSGVDLLPRLFKARLEWRNLVVLDNADQLSREAQKRLRGDVMTEEKLRFLVICTDIKKIIRPVQSRCPVKIYLGDTNDQAVRKRYADRLAEILAKEGMSSAPDEIQELVTSCGGNVHRLLLNARIAVEQKRARVTTR